MRSGSAIAGVPTLTGASNGADRGLICRKRQNLPSGGTHQQGEQQTKDDGECICLTQHRYGLSLQLFDGVSLSLEQFDDAIGADQMGRANDYEGLVCSLKMTLDLREPVSISFTD